MSFHLNVKKSLSDLWFFLHIFICIFFFHLIMKISKKIFVEFEWKQSKNFEKWNLLWKLQSIRWRIETPSFLNLDKLILYVFLIILNINGKNLSKTENWPIFYPMIIFLFLNMLWNLLWNKVSSEKDKFILSYPLVPWTQPWFWYPLALCAIKILFCFLIVLNIKPFSIDKPSEKVSCFFYC